jgi:guanosine-3',5'-bis(diphosphate) 3'-pyrophosphohydrolase
MHVDIKAINIHTDDGVFDGEITLKVHNEKFLSEITKKLEKIEGIVKITRTYKHNQNIKT